MKGLCMDYITTKHSITHKVLNEDTGELESKQFSEQKQRKRIKGGFRMVYLDYDKALLQIIKSAKDLELVISIRDTFTYQQVEVHLSPTDMHTTTGIAKSKITEVIKRMVTTELLKKVKRGTYRLNPYMYLPYRGDGEQLQAEWNNLK